MFRELSFDFGKELQYIYSINVVKIAIFFPTAFPLLIFLSTDPRHYYKLEHAMTQVFPSMMRCSFEKARWKAVSSGALALTKASTKAHLTQRTLCLESLYACTQDKHGDDYASETGSEIHVITSFFSLSLFTFFYEVICVLLKTCLTCKKLILPIEMEI